jgi:ParB-like chromosome segregation protein Spo0J
MSDTTTRLPLGFEETSLQISLGDILPLRIISERVKSSSKYAQIKASISEVGIIEAPVVIRSSTIKNKFTILDGHLRVEILREQGATDIVCLIATEEEAFSYNKRVSRIATIQEHRMILNAVKKGVSEERLAKALNINIASLRLKQKLLHGICPEVVTLLADKHVPVTVFSELRRLKPVRQIEAAQLMIAMNNFSQSYCRSIVAATTEELLVSPRAKISGLSDQKLKIMKQESANLEREFRSIEMTYSSDHLDLNLSMGYIARLLGNVRVVTYLAQHYPDIFEEFRKQSEINY